MQLIFEIEQSLLAGQGEFIQERDGMSDKVIYEGDRALLVDRRHLEYKSFQACSVHRSFGGAFQQATSTVLDRRVCMHEVRQSLIDTFA